MVVALIQFIHDKHWIDFRYAELDSLLQLHDLVPREVYEIPAYQKSAFLLVKLPSLDVAESICKRSVLIKYIIDLWAEADSLEKLVSQVKLVEAERRNEMSKSVGTEAPPTWSVTVEAFTRTLTHEQKHLYREEMKFLNFPGQVNLKEPQAAMCLLFDFHLFDRDVPIPSDPEVPCYFGRVAGIGGMKKIQEKFNLKNRLYLGPTSLDHGLAFLMNTLCLVKAHDLVMDPFVGTASVLIASQFFGAEVFGCDIDHRVIRGDMYAGKANRKTDKTKRDVFENFRAYGLNVPEILRLDNHLADRHFEQDVYSSMFDAMITDPPYGIRAGARKSGRKNETLSTEQIEGDGSGCSSRNTHVPSTQVYAVEEVMVDLLHSAATALVMFGRLAYLIPTTYDFDVSDLPLHPCFRIVQLCVQPLSCRHSRHCVVLEKYRAYDSVAREEYTIYSNEVMESARRRILAEEGGSVTGVTDTPACQPSGFGHLMVKLQQALSVGAYTDDAVKKQESRGSKIRKESRALRHQMADDGKMGEHMKLLHPRGASLPHHNCGKGHKYKEQYKEMLEKNETTARSGDMGGAEVGGIPSTTSSSAGSASEGADVSLPHKRSVGDRDE